MDAERIGHGITAVRDPELLSYLAERQIPLEISPTSNVRTRAIGSLDERPLARIVEAGVPVSINSDDPPMFGTTLAEEYAIAARLLELDARGVADLAKAAVEQRFMPASAKATLKSEIDTYTAKNA